MASVAEADPPQAATAAEAPSVETSDDAGATSAMDTDIKPAEPENKKITIKCASVSKLEELIDAQLGSLDILKAAKYDATLNSLNSQVRHQERKAKEISKIFAECQQQLKRFKEDLEAEQGIESFSVEEPQKIESGDDSDDEDVMIVGTTANLGKPIGQQPSAFRRM